MILLLIIEKIKRDAKMYSPAAAIINIFKRLVSLIFLIVTIFIAFIGMSAFLVGEYSRSDKSMGSQLNSVLLIFIGAGIFIIGIVLMIKLLNSVKISPILSLDEEEKK